MKKIELTQGQVALVDDDDYEWLNQWKWHAHWEPDIGNYYAIRKSRLSTGKWVNIPMHRQILGLEQFDTREVDHIHHNTLDNRRSQLRIVTHQQNHFNQIPRRGFTWHSRDRVYEAQIIVGGKRIYLGRFTSSAQAHQAYLDAKVNYHRIGSSNVAAPRLDAAQDGT